VIERYPDRLQPAFSAADVERAQARGRIASLLGIEGGHAIEGSLGALRAYYDLGVRYMTLTHNVTLDWADSCNDVRQHGGLTDFGRDVVREMNRLGMLVDLAHTSPEVMAHALDVSEAPLISSHSSCRALTDVTRNFPDAILRRLPKNGGVIMTTSSGRSSQAAADARQGRRGDQAPARGPGGPGRAPSPERAHLKTKQLPKATIGDVADHGSTRAASPARTMSASAATTTATRSGSVGMEDVSTYPVLFAELIQRGWSDRDLASSPRQHPPGHVRGRRLSPPGSARRASHPAREPALTPIASGPRRRRR
jgi:membrane dipeptidase